MFIARVSLLLLCAWFCLPACAPEEEEGGAAGAAGVSSSSGSKVISACVYEETSYVQCIGIPGGPNPETSEKCVEGWCPDPDGSRDSGACYRRVSRKKMRTFAGTCAEYQAAKSAGEIVFPTCEVRVDVGRQGCSDCLQRFCCDESRLGAQDAGMDVYLACARACYEKFPVDLSIDLQFDHNDEARRPCQRACNDQHRPASDALGPLRGCQSSECSAECRISAL